MKKLFLPILPIVAALLFGCNSEVVVVGVVDGEVAQLGSEKEKKLIESLDDHLGSFVSNGHAVDFESKPGGYGLGYSKQYAPFDRRSWATVFFFHARMSGLTDGIASEEFKEMYETNTSDAYIGSAYVGVKDKKDTAAAYNGIKFRRFQFAGRRKDMERDTNSTLFLTIYKGTFLKVRIDWVAEYREGARDVEDFMNALTENLKKNNKGRK